LPWAGGLRRRGRAVKSSGGQVGKRLDSGREEIVHESFELAEAEARSLELVGRVEAGEIFQITRGGRAVAVLLRAEPEAGAPILSPEAAPG
jgi:hypothetical protein